MYTYIQEGGIRHLLQMVVSHMWLLEWNSRPLEEQPMLLNTEPSLRPPYGFFKMNVLAFNKDPSAWLTRIQYLPAEELSLCLSGQPFVGAG